MMTYFTTVRTISKGACLPLITDLLRFLGAICLSNASPAKYHHTGISCRAAGHASMIMAMIIGRRLVFFQK